VVVLGGALWKFWPGTKTEYPLPSPQVQALPVPRPIHSGVKTPASSRSLSSEPVQNGQELSVVLDVPRKALVTVRILDAEGREIRNLHAGFVDPGRWTFQWDGLLENGVPASTGFYRIDVQSGTTHLSKHIQIKQ
jgi:flagellar hook assembly protein FlgD